MKDFTPYDAQLHYQLYPLLPKEEQVEPNEEDIWNGLHQGLVPYHFLHDIHQLVKNGQSQSANETKTNIKYSSPYNNNTLIVEAQNILVSKIAPDTLWK